MPSKAKFLHITDTHLATIGTELPRDDHKVKIPAIKHDTRETALRSTLHAIADDLRKRSTELDGVIFSGDAQMRGRPGGHQILLDLLIDALGPLGIGPEKVVAVPGNHDVPRGCSPSSSERYKAFIDVWRTAGCVTPWLDELDDPDVSAHKHILAAADNSWIVIPINTCNWSHVSLELPADLKTIWGEIPAMFSVGNADLKQKLQEQLAKLIDCDMARVSPEQMDALRKLIGRVSKPIDMPQLRIAVTHHHLRAPSHVEELKPFSELSNLEQLRTFLRQQNIGVLVHGHKHEAAAQYDFIAGPNDQPLHRVLMISGATFEANKEHDATRLISVDGLPRTPELAIEPFGLVRKGIAPEIRTSRTFPLWTPLDHVKHPPVTVQGNDFDEVYERACRAAVNDAKNGMLIVHLDLKDWSVVRRLPRAYPMPPGVSDSDRETWLSNLVTWWQRESSQLDHRIPYVHGNRLRRFGGEVDQIKRIVNLLKNKQTTRAIAMVIDPCRDFLDSNAERAFASFCLVQFSRRDISETERYVDCVAFYRAQEIVQWWPINVAELLELQSDIGEHFGAKPGHITTITANARSISRSPTQVAMPLIDRWLDQAPEKLHVLAIAMSKDGGLDGNEQAVMKEWLATLEELLKATSEYVEDGAPVAIEGPRILATYLNFGRGKCPTESSRLAKLLSDLANHGEEISRSENPASFKSAAARMASVLDELVIAAKRRMSEAA